MNRGGLAKRSRDGTKGQRQRGTGRKVSSASSDTSQQSQKNATALAPASAPAPLHDKRVVKVSMESVTRLQTVTERLKDACKKINGGPKPSPKATSTNTSQADVLEPHISDVDDLTSFLVEKLEASVKAQEAQGHIGKLQGKEKDSKSDMHSNLAIVRKRAESKKDGEALANARIEMVNKLLKKLKGQIDSNKFDVSDIKDSATGDIKSSKELLLDICAKLKNKQEQEKSTSDIRSEVMKMHTVLLDWRQKLPVEVAKGLRRTAPKQVSTLTEFELLQEITQLQLEYTSVVSQEAQDLMNELKQLEREIDVDIKQLHDIDKTDFPDGPLKQARMIRRKLFNKRKDKLNKKKSSTTEKDNQALSKKLQEHEKKVHDLWLEVCCTETAGTRRESILELDDIKQSIETDKHNLKSFDDIQNCIEDVWKLMSDENNQQRKPLGNGKAKDLLSEIKLTVERFKGNRIEGKEFLDKTFDVLTEIYNLLTDSPLQFSEPKLFDEKAVVKNDSKIFHPVMVKLSKIRQCLKENRKGFELRFVDAETHTNLQKYTEKLEKERNGLLNRISQMAGARLTENNPNIADLSDVNRPTKIGELYSELYDNQWTDAFEAVQATDNKRIQFLLGILQDSYKLCGEISDNQQKALKRRLYQPTDGMKGHVEAKGKEVELSVVQSKALSELRKQSVDISYTGVITYITAKYKTWFKKGALEIYTKECIRLCWFMHVQSPPVCLDMTKGSKFDTTKYKSYTKSGKNIDFVVWPPLLLHEGGAILSKGVAEGK